MSKRDEISNDLSAYLDGELSPSRVRQIEDVLAYDKDLAGELERLKATRRLLLQLPREQAPPDFVRHVLARTERTHLLPAPAARLYRSFRWISYAAAAVVLMAVGAAAVMIVNNNRIAKHDKHDTDAHTLGQLARAPQELDKQPGAMKAAPESPAGGAGQPKGQGKDSTGRRPLPIAAKGGDGAIEDLKMPAPATTPPERPGQHKNDLHREELARQERQKPAASGEEKPNLEYGGDAAGGTGAGGHGYAGKVAEESEGREVAAKSALRTSKGRDLKTKEGGHRVAAAGKAAKGSPAAEPPSGAVAAGPAKDMVKDQPSPPAVPAVPEPVRDEHVASVQDKGGNVMRRGGDNWKGETAIAPPESLLRQRQAGERPATAGGANQAVQSESLPANSVVINTSSLSVAQRDIENAMVRNGVRPLVVKEQRSLGAATIGNYYLTNVNNDRQVQYEAFVTGDQLARLRGELSVIRAQQDVAQVPAETAPAAQQAQATQRQDFNDRNSYDYWNNEAVRAATNAANSINNRPQTRPQDAKAPAGEGVAIVDAPPMPLNQEVAAQTGGAKEKKAAVTQPASATSDVVQRQIDETARQQAHALNPLNQNAFDNETRKQTNLFRLVVTLNGKMASGQAQFEDARAAKRQAPATSAAEPDMQQRNSPGLK